MEHLRMVFPVLRCFSQQKSVGRLFPCTIGEASQCSVHYESNSDSEDQQRAVEAESYIQSLMWLSKRRLLLKSFVSSLKTFSGKKRNFQRALHHIIPREYGRRVRVG